MGVQTKNCPGQLKLTNEGQLISETGHSHGPLLDEIENLKMKNLIKEAAIGTTYSKKDIYSKIYLENNIESKQKKKSVYKNIDNQRKKEGRE